MKNWSGFLQWSPVEIFYPSTENEIIDIVKKANEQGKKIRIIGSGHSFTPLSSTDDFLISLDKFAGVISINKDKNQAIVKAGTKLNVLNDLLFRDGLALENMGDIDVQSIAGAISTGTHGTGTAFGNISTQVIAIKFINGLGEVVECSLSNNLETFKAAQVSLGTLGILTELTIQCIPAYNLFLSVDKATLEDVLLEYQKLNENNRHFEFYWFPNTPYVMTKKVNVTTASPDTSSFKTYMQEHVLENYGFKLVCEIAHKFPSSTRKVSNFSASLIDKHVKTNHSHKVFSTPRIVRFNEMEYNVPVESYLEVKKELVNWINRHNYDVMFPIENRFVKGDDIYLSPAYKRDSAYIAVHVYNKKSFKKYFDALESIFKAHNGRPHWGKMHTQTAADLQSRYPMFEKFKAIRSTQDPNELFLSPYLESIFGNAVS